MWSGMEIPPNFRFFQCRYDENHATSVLTFDCTSLIDEGNFRTVRHLKWSLKSLLPGATGPDDVKFIGHLDAQDNDTIEEVFGEQGKSEENPIIVKLLQPLPPRSAAFPPKPVDTEDAHHAGAQGRQAPGGR
ncbi:unnamed protein product [Vitrella brassicaformis CCMP3155]|uniref:Uncharacterized protein n=2 Tax=Vitrella brassicaformis TaxID=1169539 RepID=A0A0G4FDN1_VITBC|nr:unnamed protein product [Vitrella brassicaformis CCMP3155]|mmetsp:Transcript_13024/g.31118  ORF Transcript_13024/g.31118 Transcript_13024/m.31118 type:complete len:132 (+) Transcript_13024:37-432(+)|eukprot:CEM10983.1 unnamed protein product [Vitrella brassicaformis CCMP3155]